MSTQDSSPQGESQRPVCQFSLVEPLSEATLVATEVDPSQQVSPLPQHDMSKLYARSSPEGFGAIPLQFYDAILSERHPDLHADLWKTLEERLSEMKIIAWKLFQARFNISQRTNMEEQFWTTAWRALNQRKIIIDAIVVAQGGPEHVESDPNVSFIIPRTHDDPPVNHFMMWLDHLTELIRSTCYRLRMSTFQREMKRFFAFVRTIPHEAMTTPKSPKRPSRREVEKLSGAVEVLCESVCPDEDHDGYDASTVTIPGHLRGIPEVEEFIKVISELKENRDTARREENRQEADGTNTLIEELRDELRGVIKSLERSADWKC